MWWMVAVAMALTPAEESECRRLCVEEGECKDAACPCPNKGEFRSTSTKGACACPAGQVVVDGQCVPGPPKKKECPKGKKLVGENCVFILPELKSPTLGSLLKLPGGSYTMGSPTTESGRDTDETQHTVTLSSFWIMEREVTQAMWIKVMGGVNPSVFPYCADGCSMGGTNPSSFSKCGSSCPVENISWCDAVIFANKASELDGRTPVAYILPEGLKAGDLNACTMLSGYVELNLDAPGYRLPTEAEWEYAARGGEGHLYAGSNSTETVAWYDDNSSSKTHPTCGKWRNGYGLCDMSGNVWEWVWDWYEPDYTKLSTAPNPTGPSAPTSVIPHRVYRGGNWDDPAPHVRIANRAAGFTGDFLVWGPGYRAGYRGFRLSGSLAPGD